MAITLAQARTIIDAGFLEADKRDIRKVAIVVTDAGGDIRAAMRSDEMGNFGTDTAHGKARAALGFNVSSLKLAQIFGSNPSAVIGINAATGQRFTPLGGAVPVTDSSGAVLGAASMSGALPDVDDEVIRIAVRAAGLVPMD